MFRFEKWASVLKRYIWFQPHFILLPVVTKLSFRRSKIYIRIPPHYVTKVFLVNTVKKQILAVCMNCHINRYDNHERRLIEFKVFPNEYTFQSINSKWNELQIVYKTTKTKIKIKSTLCPNEIQLSVNTRFVKDETFIDKSMQNCIETILMTSLNCTYDTICYNTIYLLQPRDSVDLNNDGSILSYSPKNLEAAYVLLIKKSDSLNVFSFLVPFEWYGWILVLV